MPTIVSMPDAEQMYMNTFVEVDDSLVGVHTWDGERLAGVNVLTGEKVSFERDADRIFSPVKHMLGYMQIAGTATFLQRRPIRQYRVGWSDRNVDGLPSTTQILRSKSLMESFVKMLRHEYPGMSRAYRGAIANDSRVAFDRQFAVDYAGRILYKGNHVGNYDGKKFTLAEKRQYLKPQLDQLNHD